MRRLLTTIMAAVVLLGFQPWFLTLTHASQAPPASTPPALPLSLKVGDIAPDFTLRDQSGKEVSLKDFHGKKSVVLAFYVFAFSGG
jgi:cytochrome oxidase Cu insertion factor (SCO1/SenC/PrrC family)